MRLIDPNKNPVTPTPDHTGVTSQEIAGKLIGAKTCEVKLGVYEPGGRSIVHTPRTPSTCSTSSKGN
jgi:hypothetical protein